MAEYNTEQFEKDCKALGVTLSDEQIRQFLKYFEMLVEWNEVISALGLTGVETIHGRAEDYAKPGKCREKYDLCVSRAVANLSTLSEYCLPFVKVGGKFISYKSEKITEEMNAAQHAVKILGGKMDGQVEFTLPDSDIYRNLFIITKQKSTPAKYPRKAGLPSKEPLL